MNEQKLTDQIPLQNPEQEGHTEALASLEAFAHNEGLVEMAQLFGAEELPENTAERLSVLQKIATENWDFRKGAERQAVNWNDELLDQEGTEQWETVFTAANKLGLVESSEPEDKDPDFLVILGGANKAPLDRLRYGLEKLDSFGQVAYLGSSRPVSDAEREKAKDYAPDAQTEFDLGCGAFETLLGAKQVDEIIEERNGDTWGMRLYEFEHEGEVKHGFVLSTPQTIGERRATTYDNYRFFADRAELEHHPDASVVAVTTGFYTQGQGIPAVQELTLPHGTHVETIGHDAAYSGVVRKPSQLLQEAKSAIDAAVRLEAELNS
jgi:hypothetical protein